MGGKEWLEEKDKLKDFADKEAKEILKEKGRNYVLCDGGKRLGMIQDKISLSSVCACVSYPLQTLFLEATLEDNIFFSQAFVIITY